jgi:DNA-binding beta-propeller fold protein YncE
MTRKYYAGVGFLAVLGALAIGSSMLQQRAVVEAAGAQAPRFEVDPMWPKPLPNHWVIGATIGVAVDANDHVWIIHRASSLEAKEQYATWNPPASQCCVGAPPILEFNAEGDLVGHWGGPGEGYDWPASNHGIDVDYKGNVWIGGNGRGRQAAAAALPHDESKMGVGSVHDSMVLKFTKSGKFLMQIGKPNQGAGSNDIANLKLPAKTLVDPKTNELYVADGYGNRRVIVFDADTGAYKRHWGAYGKKPDDTQLPPYNPKDPPAQQFRTPVHAVVLANDGLLYACDRTNDRIQVFKTDGTYVNEVFIEKETLGDGSTFDVTLSRDPGQKYLYVADGSNMKIHVVQRDTLEVLTTFGDGGRQPGQFYAVHSIATDSKGNLYTTETYRGQRVQKFVYKGLAPVTKKDQGVVWPSKPTS